MDTEAKEAEEKKEKDFQEIQKKVQFSLGSNLE
jgi:hypothetical protein